MDIRSSIRRWASYRQTVRQLQALNTRQLGDLGLTRADIPAVARDKASMM